MKFLIVATVVTLLVGARSSRADSEESAATRFQQGVELYREGSYEGALAEFRRAYQLSPSYRVLFNIAQAQHALRDFVGAHKSLVQYLADGGADVSGERRTQVEDMASKMADRIAYLHVSVNVAGADIRIDDVSVGSSPLPGPVAVNLGTRKVSASKAGLPAAVRVLTVAGRERVKVDLAIDEQVLKTPAAATATIPALTVAAAKPAPPTTSGHAGLITTLSMTAAFAVGTGVFGYWALGAQHDLNSQLSTFPNTRDKIEDARSHSRTYGRITDALGAATLISGGAALYFALTSDWRKGSKPPAANAAAIAPTLGGVVVRGGF